MWILGALLHASFVICCYFTILENYKTTLATLLSINCLKNTNRGIDGGLKIGVIGIGRGLAWFRGFYDRYKQARADNQSLAFSEWLNAAIFSSCIHFHLART